MLEPYCTTSIPGDETRKKRGRLCAWEPGCWPNTPPDTIEYNLVPGLWTCIVRKYNVRVRTIGSDSHIKSELTASIIQINQSILFAVSSFSRVKYTISTAFCDLTSIHYGKHRWRLQIGQYSSRLHIGIWCPMCLECDPTDQSAQIATPKCLHLHGMGRDRCKSRHRRYCMALPWWHVGTWVRDKKRLTREEEANWKPGYQYSLPFCFCGSSRCSCWCKSSSIELRSWLMIGGWLGNWR